MARIALTIEYVGTAYAGWQIQPNAPTVQGVMCKVATDVFGTKTNVTGCSRTDSGVHALEYLCVLDFEGKANNIPIDKIPCALNNSLPDDIAVKSAWEVAEDFHPRYSMGGKQYIYKIHNSTIRDPFSAGRAYHYPAPLDDKAMDKAAKRYIGLHDFASFMAQGSSVESTERTIYDASVHRNGDEIVFAVSGNGFLYNMVRIMAGTLIDVGRGKITPDEIEGIIASKDRNMAGQTLPPHGLYLNKVLKGGQYEKR